MPPGGPGTGSRAPGSFSPLSTPLNHSYSAQSLQLRRVESSSSEDSSTPSVTATKRPQNAPAQRPPPLPANTVKPNFSTSSLQNFSRPSIANARISESPARTVSPLSLASKATPNELEGQTRKHSHSQGFFEPSLTTSSILSSSFTGNMAPPTGLSASQIAAQAAMQHQSAHQRQRSQTLPAEHLPNSGFRKTSRGPTSPPLLSLTEASVGRESGFGSQGVPSGQVYRNGLLGGTTNPAATAANVVFQRSPHSSPVMPPAENIIQQREPEKPAKASKVKLFSRPGKLSLGKEAKDKPLPSPNKLGTYNLGGLQKNNLSMQSLAEAGNMSSSSSMYSLANSSNATIRAFDAPVEKEKEKDKKHHFLSRQKHKLSNKDDHHLPLSSAASNSRPVDPNAPSSLYNFGAPSSPGPSTTSFAKSMSGLDIRHGGRALREKKKEERAAAGLEPAFRDGDMTYQGGNEWPGSSSLGSTGASSFLGPSSTSLGYASSVYSAETQDLSKYGLSNMTADDAWPFLRAKLLIIFEGEDLRLPVEDFNRLVSTHLQRCIQKRSPHIIVEDLRDLLATGFGSLDQSLRRTPDDRLIPHLVEMWLFTFTSILPYMQAVFLPLDLEFSGHGPLMSTEKARDFWGTLPSASFPGASSQNGNSKAGIPAGQMLEVRRIVLTAYRDTVILPRFENLKNVFSRLSLDSINTNVHHGADNLSSSPSSSNRPTTAMSLDPLFSSYSSQSTTLLGGAESTGARSRAISNVSHGSEHSITPFQRATNFDPSAMPPPPARPFTPSSSHPSLLGIGLGIGNRDLAAREANADDSKRITETVGRMLQCMSVLASVGVMESGGDEEAQARMEELCKALKLNWLGRGRTGRNRRGLVGARVRRDDNSASML